LAFATTNRAVPKTSNLMIGDKIKISARWNAKLREEKTLKDGVK
jgi:hypothetical protein